MKFPVSPLGVALSLTLAVAAHAQPESKINVGTLNTLVGRMVKEVLLESQQGENPLFTALELKLDDKGTDLSSPDRIQVKLDASAGVSRTRWSAPASVSLSIAGGADKVSQLANISFTGGLKTDVLALARYVALTAQDDYCKARRYPDPYDKEGKYDALACAELKKAPQLTDVRGVVETIATINRFGLEYNRNKLSQLDTLYKQAPAAKAGQYKWQIDAAQRELDNGTRFDQELTKALQQNTSAASFTLDIRSLTLEGWGELKDLTFQMDATSVNVGLKFVSTKIRDIESYFAFKPQVEKYLLDLQNGDEKAIQEVKELAKGYLYIVKMVFDPAKG